MGKKYRIEVRVGGNPPTALFYVYKALGPWPLKNWSWYPSFVSTDRAECQAYIDEAMRVWREADAQ